MTMDVDEMEAGKELDAEIQTRVFARPGRFVERVKINGRWRNEETWLDAGFEPDVPPCGIYAGMMPSCFSTKITAALSVVEKIRCTDEAPDEVYWKLIDCASLGWRAEIWRNVTENDGDVEIANGLGDTLPLAICRAALKALSQP